MNSEINRVIKDRFLLEEHLGEDPLGDVYRAIDLRQQEAGIKDDRVAIKILKQQHSKKKELIHFLQEETTRSRKLQTKNVIAVYDFDRDGDTLYTTMELVDGEPLDSYLAKQSGKLPVDEALDIVRGICEAMKVAHATGLLHNNFSPAKVFYTTDKIAKVFDFGIGTNNSSSCYASCEKLGGEPATVSDDVFSAAVVAYELLAGSHPFNGLTAVKAAEENLVPGRIDGLSDTRWNALRNALALDQAERTSSIEEFERQMG